jgi:hypothetical protein
MVVTFLIVDLFTVKYVYFGSRLDQNALKPEIHLIYKFILSPKCQYSSTGNAASHTRQYKSLKISPYLTGSTLHPND